MADVREEQVEQAPVDMENEPTPAPSTAIASESVAVGVVDADLSKRTVVEPIVGEPTVSEPTVCEPTVSEPTVTEPDTTHSSRDDASTVENVSSPCTAPEASAPVTPKSEEAAVSARASEVGALQMLCQYGDSSDSEQEEEHDDKKEDSAIDMESDGTSKDPTNAADTLAAKNLLDSALKATDAYRLVTSEDSNADSDEDDDDDDVLSSIADDDETLEFLKKCMGNDSAKPHNSTKNELSFADLPPIADLKITVPESECVEIGAISGIVGTLVMVESLANFAAVDIDTVLFLDKGHQALGHVFDVMGVVSSPIYCVRFNSSDDIENRKIKIGLQVYVAPKTEYTQFVVLNDLMKERGCDASTEHDEEAADREYSDDEDERSARQQQRHKKRPNPLATDAGRNKTVARAENAVRPNAHGSGYSARGQPNRPNFRGRRGAPGHNQFPPHHMQQYNPNHSWHHAIPPPHIQQQMAYNQFVGMQYGHPNAYQMPRTRQDPFNLDAFPPLPSPNNQNPFGS